MEEVSVMTALITAITEVVTFLVAQIGVVADVFTTNALGQLTLGIFVAGAVIGLLTRLFK